MRFSTDFTRFSARIAFAIIGAIGATVSFGAQAYDLRIANRTTFAAVGQVNYAACRADTFSVAPGQTWSTNGRGLCLITSIVAGLQPATAGQQAPGVTAYSSSGTSYADFAIAQSGGAYRVWSVAELANQPPAPTPTPPPAPKVAPTPPPPPAPNGLRVVNKTSFKVHVSVGYDTCTRVDVEVAARQTWTATGRGQCLITVIGSYVYTSPSNNSGVAATAYQSKGSSYSDFEVETSGSGYRVWSPTEAAAQTAYAEALAAFADEAEPTTTVRWEAVAAGMAPPAAALKGGQQRMGGSSDPTYDLLPVCRGQVNGVFATGNAAPFYSNATGWSWKVLRCYVFIDGKEQELAAYEVLLVDSQVALQNPDAVRWTTGTNGALPDGAFNAAKVGQTIRICRAQYSDGGLWTRVGTMGQTGCNFPYGGQNRSSANYEVLVVNSAARQQIQVRGANEPRLAAEPDRPARVWQPADNCSTPNGRCSVRAGEFRAMGAYRINAVATTDTTGRETALYKKTQGGIWMEYTSDGSRSNTRPYAEVERNDNAIILFSGPWDFGGQNGKVTSQTIIIALNFGYVNAAGTEQLVQGGDITWLRSDPKFREGYKWIGSMNYMARAMMAEPDTAMALTMKPANAAQTTTYWKGGTQPAPLLRGTDGQFGEYRVGTSGDGWLELYTTVSPQRSGTGKWQIQFLRVDFWRNRVWELLGVTDQTPTGLSVDALRTLARSAGPSKAWAEAYELTNASVFSGINIGAALGRLTGSTQQMAWTLREQVGPSTLRWEELKNDVVSRQSGVAEGSPVGRMLTETARDARSLTLSGSELGSSIVIDWVAGTVATGGRKVADFLTGDAEYPGQRKLLPRPTPPGVSPGFQFINKTDWPVQIKISQVGCLYYGVVPPHSTMTRNTGAVWFTLSAAWSADGKDLTSEQVFTDCVAPVAFTTLGVIAAAATGGSAVGVVALGAASAATAGAATTAVQFMNAAGASQLSQDATAAAIFVVGAAATGGVGAFQVVSTKIVPGTAASVVRQTLAAAASKGAAHEALVTMKDEAINYALYSAANAFSEPTDKDMTVLQSWFESEISLAGQYAGYPWPWKMKDRVMPQYEITGGPRVDTLKDGSKLIRKGSTFKFTRVN